MPAPKQQPQAAQPASEPMYPVIESFVERANGEDVSHLFDSVRDALTDLKGPKAEQKKKVEKALERTEELLSHLLQVREKLEAEKKGGGKARK